MKTFLGGLVVKSPLVKTPKCRGLSSISSWGTKIPHAAHHGLKQFFFIK